MILDGNGLIVVLLFVEVVLIGLIYKVGFIVGHDGGGSIRIGLKFVRTRIDDESVSSSDQRRPFRVDFYQFSLWGLIMIRKERRKIDRNYTRRRFEYKNVGDERGGYAVGLHMQKNVEGG